jgi:hypothetical protein
METTRRIKTVLGLLAGPLALLTVGHAGARDPVSGDLAQGVRPFVGGSLPRTHCYERGHTQQTVSGLAVREKLATWVKGNLP